MVFSKRLLRNENFAAVFFLFAKPLKAVTSYHDTVNNNSMNWVLKIFFYNKQDFLQLCNK